MGHHELSQKSDFDAAINDNPGKNVLVYCYKGEVHPKADEHAGKHSDTTKSYKVDVEKHEEAVKYFSITKTPTFVIYKDGKEVKRIEGDEGPKMKELVEFLSG